MSDEQMGHEPVEQPPAADDKETRNWAMILHLSQFAMFILPLAGVIAPIVIWLIKRDEMPAIDEHGKNVVNWIISAFIYGIVSTILIVVVIGIFGLIVLSILAIVFPIIGAVKANQGECWRYPLSIRFLK